MACLRAAAYFGSFGLAKKVLSSSFAWGKRSSFLIQTSQASVGRVVEMPGVFSWVFPERFSVKVFDKGSLAGSTWVEIPTVRR